MSKKINWNLEKNIVLKNNRKITFEEIVLFLENGALLDIIENKNYGNQKIYILNIDNYAYLVPFVENEEEIFLKTIIPSRVMTKKYLG